MPPGTSGKSTILVLSEIKFSIKETVLHLLHLPLSKFLQLQVMSTAPPSKRLLNMNIFNIIEKYFLVIKTNASLSKFWFCASESFFFFNFAKIKSLIIITAIYRADTTDFRCWRSSRMIFRPKTNSGLKVSIKVYVKI